MHPTSSPLVVLGMAALALLVTFVVVLGHARVTSWSRSVPLAGALAAWLALTGAAGASGVLRHWDSRPPPIFPLLFVAVVLTVLLARSRVGTRMARGLPLA